MSVPEQLLSDEALRRVIGEAARAARKALGLTLEQVAEKVEITVEFYARIERGKSLPSLETLCRIAKALDVEVARLLGLEEMEGPVLIGPELPESIAYIVEQARRDDKLYKAIIAVLNAAKSP
jgi:transcriptional regulator with XRE-family HTH domain